MIIVGRYHIKLVEPNTIGEEIINPNIAFLESVRNINKESLILSPGLGVQNGVIEYKDNKIIYSASRSIINSKDYRSAVLPYLV